MSSPSSQEGSTASSTNGSTQGSRAQSVSGGIRHGPPKPRHNVKFSMGLDDEEDVQENSSKRFSLPELRLSEPDHDSESLPFPAPVADTVNWNKRKDAAALNAHDKANRHADRVKRHQAHSAPSSRRTSYDGASTIVGTPSPYMSPKQKPLADHPVRFDDIPLADLMKEKTETYVLDDDDTSDTDREDVELRLKPLKRQETEHLDEAKRLVRTFTTTGEYLAPGGRQHQSGTATPAIDQRSHEYDYVPRPENYKPSILSMLLSVNAATIPAEKTSQLTHQQNNYLAKKLAPYENAATDPRRITPDYFTRKQMPRSPGSLSGTQTPLSSSEQSSGYLTPRQKRPKWYKADERQLNSMGSLGSSSQADSGLSVPETATQQKPVLSRTSSTSRIDSALSLIKHPISHMRKASSGSSGNVRRPATEEQYASIAERLASQEYLIEMCKALMAYGAPTHRLEELMQMAARKLQIYASFQYLPSCMIVSFDDPDTHTTELKLVKEPTAVDLGKLKEVQEVYKDVMHNQYSVMEAMDDIREIRNRKKRFNTITLILMYGIAAVSVGPFAFSARPIDFPIAFLLGIILGSLQLGLATRSAQFSHIFEVAGTFVTSLAARGFGSILSSSGQPIFCFSALAQSSIALILPGWIILSAALELQSRNIIAGSIRMVYAIIYTLFLGFGILIGTTIMGLMYTDATNDLTCEMPWYWNVNDPSERWKLIYTKFMWVPVFTICLAMINQAKFKQMPWMCFISVCGYQVNYWSSIRFSQNIQVANALGAFVIGLLANLYSRLGHGVAAATMLPAIFVMVPSGLAASGSLVAGLTSANQITHNVTGISIVNNGTQGFYDAQNVTSSTNDSLYGGTIFNVGYGMVQVAIGISVGLFLSALVIYPFGKKRSGIFSF
ncbi:pheromone-regulated protein prm10 [Neophaeococcomyces mojaviensis]|uniref:Pheromone-regulated protein prm10 n=1 Tax=Neophaeococcomyces mojaviensis TaxID=3383035 RepID=A0ACC2ZZI3_9EURO|nr:pheromone-regulated protein prm10 [Knufia sp. JES_112]